MTDQLDIAIHSIGDPGCAAANIRPGASTAPPCWPDTALDTARIAGLEIRAASVRGLLHRFEGSPRQDGYSFVWQQDPDALIVTVCDGLGSLNESHEAAALVSQHMAAALTRDPDSDELRWAEAFATCSNAIDSRIADTGGEMATTVVCACITAVEERGYRAEVAWVGDSAAYLLEGSTWQVVGGSVKTVQAGDEPMASATKALPDSAPRVHTSAVEFRSGTALFLMTDGVADPLGEGRGEVGEALASWWSCPPDKFTFGAQVDFARRSFDDDRTVVGVWPVAKDDAR